MPPKATTLWPIRPRPGHGEVLSSWLSRIAADYQLSLRRFRKIALMQDPWTRTDIDLIEHPSFFEKLTGVTAVATDELYRMSYVGDEGLVHSRTVLGTLEWIAPLTTVGGSWRQSSIPFCPACLATDDIPFYRKRWRYAFAPLCEKHGLLTNSCPACGHPYSYEHSSMSNGVRLSPGVVDRCRRCYRRFSSMAAPSVHEDVLEAACSAQRQLLSALDTGWVQLTASEFVHICMYLRGIHDLAMMLINPTHGEAISRWVYGQSALPGAPVRVKGSLEARSAGERAMVLAQATWLVHEWPSRLVAMITDLGPLHGVLPPIAQRPAWMARPDLESFSLIQPGRSDAEFAAAKAILERRRNWPARNYEVWEFMRTGVAREIKRSRAPTDKAFKALVKTAYAKATAKLESWARVTHAAKTAPLEPSFVMPREFLDEDVLVDLDDNSEIWAALANWKRSARTKLAD